VQPDCLSITVTDSEGLRAARGRFRCFVESAFQKQGIEGKGKTPPVVGVGAPLSKIVASNAEAGDEAAADVYKRALAEEMLEPLSE
jgi:hypothetical protein